MSRLIVDFAVIALLFAFGIAWTVFRYGARDRVAFVVIAIASPVLAVVSVFMLIFDLVRGNVQVGPCPNGLTEAERIVEEERQRMFGGDLRQPTFSISWQRAYEMELQRGAERVQRMADRVFA